MAKTAVIPSTRKTTLGKLFAIGRLPVQYYGQQKSTIRKPPQYELTVGAAFDSSSSDQLSLTLTKINGATPAVGSKVFLDANLVLDFGTSKIVKIAEGIEVGTTATPVTILDPDTAITLAITNKAITKALLFVHGCSNATISPQIQNEDGTTYSSGTGKEMTTVGNAKELAFEFKETYGDKGGEVLLDIMYEDSEIGRDFYFESTEPDGEKHEGVAILNSASPQGGVQKLKTVSGSAQVQGNTYIHTKATLTVTT